ncbi:helix-turn-helix transcriptional regulator [Streptacidiphilus sp. N1-12]|uniref:Helix-turn-helix transcriptional regulator n=2 Tax=Streptacidiphilus alkalitolerans TaxID=3342712 RepID=A0ABV6WEK8_9ACTN
MVEAPRPTETLADIASRTDRSLETVRGWSKTSTWPAPAGRVGRAHAYATADVDAWLTRHILRTVPALQPRRLYTAAEIERATGIKVSTIRSDVSRGNWPAPDDTSQRAHRWYGHTVNSAVANRHPYRQSD